MKTTIGHPGLLTILLTTLLTLSCDRNVSEEVETRSAYYWSTTWRADSALKDLVAEQGISRIYLRFFDVVVDDHGEVMPNATLRFSTPMIDSVEVVPTVFIVNDCMSKDTGKLDQLLFRRIMQMCETHDVNQVKEIQIDCDWTQRTRKAYFDMLGRLRQLAHDKGLRLSATIRLHQLSQEAPPVDRGVLMMYNTGNAGDINKNPILDLDDASPYMRYLKNYDLPLSAAYPVFAWDLLFRGNRLVGVMHSDDDLPVMPGDTIIRREAPLDTVLLARDAIGRLRHDVNQEVILFDISNQNIQRIKTHSYEKIYRH